MDNIVVYSYNGQPDTFYFDINNNLIAIEGKCVIDKILEAGDNECIS